MLGTLSWRRWGCPLVVAGLLASSASFAKDRAALRNPPEAARKLVPGGWAIEALATGDISRDGLADLVMILRQQDAQNVIANPESCASGPLDSNPRLLLVALGRPKHQGYRLVAEDRALIPIHDDACMEDPLGGPPEIRNGSFKLSTRIFMNAGGWDVSDQTFAFRFQDDCVRLIGYESYTANRGSGDTSGLSVNYLTGRKKAQTGNFSKDAPDVVEWSKLESNPKLCLDDIGNAFEFEPGR